MKRLDAVVVGSGPNGLSAAVALARAGFSVKVLEAQPTPGGGARTLPLTLPGYRHDVCSAIHPLAAASPFFRELKLETRGVRFIHPAAPLAHPLDGGQVAMLERSVDETAAGLGADEHRYRALMAPLVRDFDEVLLPLVMNPVTQPPLGTPFKSALFGLKALQSAQAFAESHFVDPRTRALLGGCAAHSFAPLTAPLTNSVALMLAVSGHAVGWPMLEGGSQALVHALLEALREAGGELETGHPVTSLAELDDARLVLFDTNAHAMSAICGDALPPAWHEEVAGFRRGQAVFKLDYALSGPMPWAAKSAARAGTLHLGGTLEQLATSEAAVNAGQLSDRPYTLVAQHSGFDPTRAPAGHHTLWAYCHVPNGSTVDATDRIEAQFDRFAPGWRSLVLARASKGPRELEAGNANYLGGDISAGAMDGLQLFMRPTVGLPYVTPNPRLLLCSSSAPPGPGVHGMCGFHAAQVAIARLRK
jgi:phytoene dehydrogenase-like protein